MAANPRLRSQKAKRDKVQPRNHSTDPAHDSELRLPETASTKPAEKPSDKAHENTAIIFWLGVLGASAC